MLTLTRRTVCALLFVLAASSVSSSPAQAQGASSSAVILTREQASAVIPAKVFYRGQSASVQARNSTGLKLAGDKLVLVATVDTAGYSSAIQQNYQAYLLTEVPLQIGGKMLVPGAYGIGFIAGDQFIVLDVGANPVVTVASMKDAAMARPNPMQILADPSAPGQFRLYSGRSYVSFSPVTVSQ